MSHNYNYNVRCAAGRSRRDENISSLRLDPRGSWHRTKRFLRRLRIVRENVIKLPAVRANDDDFVRPACIMKFREYILRYVIFSNAFSARKSQNRIRNIAH